MTPAGAPGRVPLLDAGLPDGVRGAFTTRGGGGGAAASRGAGRDGGAGTGLDPEEFNLGDHVGDDPALVVARREDLRRELGADSLVIARQVHGSAVAVVDEPLPGPLDGSALEADALVTTRTDVALGVVVADCVPVLLADPDAGVVGAAHAGRAGMVAGVVPAVVAAMRDLGARRLLAVTGPAVCGGCYEVPAAMRAEAAERVPAAWATTRRGTPALDVAAGVAAQLRAAGVAVRTAGGCTVEDARFFSHRREGRTGRSAGVVRLLPRAGAA